MLTVVQQLVMFRILKKREEEGIETSSQKGFCPYTPLEHRNTTPLSLLLLMVKQEQLNILQLQRPPTRPSCMAHRTAGFPARAASRQGRRAKAALKRSGFYLLHLDRQIFWKQGFKPILTKRAHRFNRHTRCKLGPRPAPSREEMCFGKQTQDGKRDASVLQQPQDRDSLGLTGLLQTLKCRETLP